MRWPDKLASRHGQSRLTPQSDAVDIWDGDNGEPAVTHGHTLTSKIPVRNVLEAIAQYAFLASPYPVILSVEVHCDFEQQERLVRILQETLGNRLVSRRLDEMELDADLDKLPSPAELKGRFLLKVIALVTRYSR